MEQLRAQAAQCCYLVIDQGKSLSEVLPKAQLALSNPQDKALLQEICFGVMRYLPQLEAVCQKLMSKPLVKSFRPLQFLLYVGVYQLHFMRIPDHAAISETVDAARTLKGQSLIKLINAVLRNVQRQPALFDFSDAPVAVRYNHPGWFIQILQQYYPEQWSAVLEANQLKGPLWLRVNVNQISVAAYTAELNLLDIAFSQPLDHLPTAIQLEQACDITQLPGYREGWFSVQDAAAQHAALFLVPENHHRVLDACSAPGGKTCHILELAPEAEVTALDKDKNRLQRVKDNLHRLGLSARTIVADAATPEAWWDGQLYDRILLDVPCSATGVIRRHPDIRWLRKKTDIAQLVSVQQQILAEVWHLLIPGGVLLYATCSILPAENGEQIAAFLQKHPDAILDLLPQQLPDSYGWQILPGEQDMDGFFYARLRKRS